MQFAKELNHSHTVFRGNGARRFTSTTAMQHEISAMARECLRVPAFERCDAVLPGFANSSTLQQQVPTLIWFVMHR